MKKIIFLVLMVLVVISVSFADTNFGVNVRDSGGDKDTQYSAEVGFQGPWAGGYATIGFTNPSALIGVTLSTPKSPFYLFGGAGLDVTKMTKTTTVTDTVAVDVVDGDNRWWVYNPVPVNVVTTTEVEDSYLQTGLIYEVGAGVDAGPFYSKLGYYNDGNHGMSLSFGLSI